MEEGSSRAREAHRRQCFSKSEWCPREGGLREHVMDGLEGENGKGATVQRNHAENKPQALFSLLNRITGN